MVMTWKQLPRLLKKLDRLTYDIKMRQQRIQNMEAVLRKAVRNGS